MNRHRGLIVSLMLAAAPAAQGLDIQLNLDASLQGNAAFTSALERGAGQWEARMADPITVTLDIGLADLGSPTIIGQAAERLLVTANDGFDLIRGALVQDAQAEPDDGIVASLPVLNQFNVRLPPGFTRTNELAGTKANFKALGFSGLDSQFGRSDGTIEFNSRFSFDVDNRDGISTGALDLETVAAHEIGHALGFVSVVDEIDVLQSNHLTGAITPRLLDLFRFDASAPPATEAQFTSASRDLVPGDPAVLADLSEAFPLATGVNNGDGRQASHFKDGLSLGVMDPTLSSGEIVTVSAADLRALDLIGFDVVPIPLPASGPLLLAGLWLLSLAGLRRRG